MFSDAPREVLDALQMSGTMAWQITWSLILGLTISATIEALVRKSTIARLLPDSGPRSLATATVLGAASSSCSYAAVALARSLFRKGADFTAAIAFQFASTNLVVELGLILGLLMGWAFTAAEFLGGTVMIVIVALLLRRLLSRPLVEQARQQADRALPGSMEGHAAMDMTSVSHNFVMEWAAISRDLVVGLLIAGAAAAWIPDSFWQHVFFVDHPVAAKIWGPLVGPLVAVVTFVCSIGNVPLAAVLWRGGISFGGVVAFIYADLLIVPILLIYRKYYGWRVTVRLALAFYLAMVLAGYVVELVFGLFGWVPTSTQAVVIADVGVSWNYTTWLNIAFLALAAGLVWRFVRTGGLPMLAMMGGGPD